MLDLMRQANRRKWFLYLLILPVIFSFVLAIFLVWGGAADSGMTAGPAAWVARVDGNDITLRDLERHRQLIMAQYRQMLGDQFEQIAAQQDFTQIALSQLLGVTLAYQEAERLGLQPTDAEIGEVIRNAPMFQRDGRFIGREQYIAELRGRNYDVAEYERDVGKEIALDKLRNLLGSMVVVTDDEVARALKEEGETAEVDYVAFRQADFQSGGEPSDREIQAYYTAHRGDYLTAEKRRASYVLLERDPLMQAAGAQVTDDEIRRHYDENRDTRYTTPEQRRASHILFKVPPGMPDDSAIATKARGVQEQIRAGGDFAQLAQTNSEDSSAAQGGDLGWFGRGRMVPEFEQAAFGLAEGQVSDLIKTQFGYHLIKVTGSRPAGATPFDEVKDSIRQQLAFGKAQEMLDQKSGEFSSKLSQQVSSFDGTAAEAGLTVKDTGLVARGDTIADLGPAPLATEEIFKLPTGGTSGPIRTPKGVVFARLVEIQEPSPAPVSEVKDRVKSDLASSRSREKARAAARELASVSAERFKEVADARKLEVKSTGSFPRKNAPATFTDAAKDAVFTAAPGSVIGPLDMTDGVAVVKVIKRSPETPEETVRLRDALREQLQVRGRDSAYRALLSKLGREASISTNDTLLAELRASTR
ncbi:MAG: peptidyl-prolyl cis-trans isomerase [Candidatus Polarisedimenticolia bacterium]